MFSADTSVYATSKLNPLTHLPLVPHIYVNELGQRWFRESPVASSAPSHYLNKCWLTVRRTLRNKLQWNLIKNPRLFIHENTFEYVVYEMAAILPRGRCVKNNMFFNKICNYIPDNWWKRIANYFWFIQMLMFKLLGHCIYGLITERYVFIHSSLCRMASERRTTEICKIILGLSYTSLWNIRTYFDEIYIFMLYICMPCNFVLLKCCSTERVDTVFVLLIVSSYWRIKQKTTSEKEYLFGMLWKKVIKWIQLFGNIFYHNQSPRLKAGCMAWFVICFIVLWGYELYIPDHHSVIVQHCGINRRSTYCQTTFSNAFCWRQADNHILPEQMMTIL